MRVLLIAGGWSSEREVSLSGARGIRRALVNLGHEVADLDPAHGLGSLFDAARRADFAFINLHGAPGEDGLLQAMLDVAGCPYQGSGPAGSYLALNKNASKAIFRDRGLPTPDWEFLPRDPGPAFAPRLPYPLFAKPNAGGSSVCSTLARDRDELACALGAIFATGAEALLEPYLPGQELTCGILGDEALPLVAIRPAGDAPFFDYASKYEAGRCEEICPAPVAPELTARVQAITLAAHRALGLAGYSRADFLVRDGQPLLLEVNTLPGMTPTSLLPQEAAAVGLDFDALIARLMELGLARARGEA
jgi:D-alanine-D-alanine ligase